MFSSPEKLPLESIDGVFTSLNRDDATFINKSYAAPRPSAPSLLDTLPAEILDRVVANLNPSDAASVHQTYNRASFKRRVDPVMYLRSTFSNPTNLLAIMAVAGCVISGSRALEYFEPHSIAADSDWDFFVGNERHGVYLMMKALENSGVAWDLDCGKFTRLVEGPIGHSEEMTISQLARAYDNMPEPGDPWVTGIYEATDEALMSGYRRSMCDLSLSGRAHVRVTKRSSVLTGTEPWVTVDVWLEDELREKINGLTDSTDRLFNPYDNRIRMVIPGRVKGSRGEHKVQLVLCNHRVLDMITSFYASHVQCFISGWCAAQLFPKETSNRQSILWNERGPPSVKRAIAKYKARGFTFVEPPRKYTFPSRRMSLYRGGLSFVSFQSFYKQQMACRDYAERNLEQAFYLLTEAFRLNSWWVRADELVLTTDPEGIDKGPMEDDVDFHREVYLAIVMEEGSAQGSPVRNETMTESFAPDSPCMVDDMLRAGLISRFQSSIPTPWILSSGQT